jgi:methionyl aminopeptidase
VPGRQRLSDISHAIQQVTEAAGFSVVRSLVGHGVGRAMHEDPQIPNYGQPGRGPVLAEGMTLAIEPMINAGGRTSSCTTTSGRSPPQMAHFPPISSTPSAVTAAGPRILTAAPVLLR